MQSFAHAVLRGAAEPRRGGQMLAVGKASKMSGTHGSCRHAQRVPRGQRPPREAAQPKHASALHTHTPSYDALAFRGRSPCVTKSAAHPRVLSVNPPHAVLCTRYPAAEPLSPVGAAGI